MMPLNARLLAGVLVLTLGACATPPQTRALPDSSLGLLPAHIELAEVPFFAQDDFQCGPAALAMTLGAAGIAVTPDILTPEVYLPQRKGSLQVEMLAATRRHGAVAYRLAPQLTDLLREVAAGTPVVVLQNLGLSWYPVWHYAVVVGYDLRTREILLRSGREQRQVLTFSTFENTWARGEYWAMTATAPERIPQTANADSYVAAISALEKTGYPERAHAAYLAALQRWPKHLLAQVGAGNSAYKMKDISRAETAFRQAVQDHPESVAALNNLAQTLIDQKRYAEALPFARQAVVLGGPMSGIAKATLGDIEGKLK
jgi:tetratricopeptide (TPR) repeat protein